MIPRVQGKVSHQPVSGDVSKEGVQQACASNLSPARSVSLPDNNPETIAAMSSASNAGTTTQPDPIVRLKAFQNIKDLEKKDCRRDGKADIDAIHQVVRDVVIVTSVESCKPLHRYQYLIKLQHFLERHSKSPSGETLYTFHELVPVNEWEELMKCLELSCEAPSNMKDADLIHDVIQRRLCLLDKWVDDKSDLFYPEFGVFLQKLATQWVTELCEWPIIVDEDCRQIAERVLKGYEKESVYGVPKTCFVALEFLIARSYWISITMQEVEVVNLKAKCASHDFILELSTLLSNPALPPKSKNNVAKTDAALADEEKLRCLKRQIKHQRKAFEECVERLGQMPRTAQQTTELHIHFSVVSEFDRDQLSARIHRMKAVEENSDYALRMQVLCDLGLIGRSEFACPAEALKLWKQRNDEAEKGWVDTALVGGDCSTFLKGGSKFQSLSPMHALNAVVEKQGAQVFCDRMLASEPDARSRSSAMYHLMTNNYNEAHKKLSAIRKKQGIDCYLLGHICNTETSIFYDESDAVAWYEKAVNSYPCAYLELINIYLEKAEIETSRPVTDIFKQASLGAMRCFAKEHSLKASANVAVYASRALKCSPSPLLLMPPQECEKLIQRIKDCEKKAILYHKEARHLGAALAKVITEEDDERTGPQRKASSSSARAKSFPKREVTAKESSDDEGSSSDGAVSPISRSLEQATFTPPKVVTQQKLDAINKKIDEGDLDQAEADLDALNLCSSSKKFYLNARFYQMKSWLYYQRFQQEKCNAELLKTSLRFAQQGLQCLGVNEQYLDLSSKELKSALDRFPWGELKKKTAASLFSMLGHNQQLLGVLLFNHKLRRRAQSMFNIADWLNPLRLQKVNQ